MIKRNWKETREYFNDENALIKSQHGFREFRLFGILISKRSTDFDATVPDKKSGVGFKTQ
jgi:hypothetical protein